VVRPSRKRFVARLALLAALALLAGACGRTGAGLLGGKVKAVATTGMIGDTVAAVGGDNVEVVSLMGPGVDPHLYKASAGDVGRINEADIVFYNGLHLEAAMSDVLTKTKTVETVAVGDAVPEDRRLRPPEFEGQFDPHVWFDVELWSRVVERVRDALVELDEKNASSYRENADAHLERLAELHEYVKTRAAGIDVSKRVLVTAHDAFNYFGRAYGFEVRGLQGISTASEAGAADVRELAAFIAQRRIPAMFVESSVPPRAIEAVRAAVRANGFEVAIGGELFSDAMGDAGSKEGTYVGMIRHNIDTIAHALGG
jgi:manganese/zinc/iron transport system substrate-binding protein